MNVFACGQEENPPSKPQAEVMDIVEKKPPPPLSGRTVQSFAYLTIKDRLPVILTKGIDYREFFSHLLG